MYKNIHIFEKKKRGILYHTRKEVTMETNSARYICMFTYVSLQLLVQNAVSAQPCVGKLGISLVLLNFLHCNFRLWFKTP